ncbi:MAG: UDP-3-O-acyl-N-acetylglucosamine deacetylase [Oligoflexia bacterium]|nr:UDP-3-O-acyl-N-acetylglucosamine deacetylase [Oligoflexia bacterium]
MLYQKTLAKMVSVEGIGLHTGKASRMTFKPAPENSGVYFLRKDIPGLPALKAQSRNVRATQMATVLGSDIFAVSTVEHCMSAVSAAQIDNLIIELEGPELPICDGSSFEYFKALQSGGVIEQNAYRSYFYITKPLYYSKGDKYAYVLPYNGFKVSCTIEFAHPKILKQKIELDVTPFSYEKELSSARTFGFIKDVEALQKQGLALGGSLKNAVVLDEKSILNPEGLRFDDEFVRHKAMDAIGDLTMLGHPLIGHVVLHKAGHDVMHEFVQKILQSPDCYRVTEIVEPLTLFA